MACEGDLVAELLRCADEGIAMPPVASVNAAIVGFEAQRAVVESLRAVLAARGVESPFVHDIAGLVELCEQSGVRLPRELAGVEALAPYAVLAYDNAPAEAVDAQTALDWGASAVSWARNIVGSGQQSGG